MIARLLGPLGTYLFGGLALMFFILWLVASAQAGSRAKALDHETNAHAKTKSELAQCKVNTETLEAAAARQSAAVTALGKAGQDATKAAQQALRAAEKASRPYQASAARLAAAKPSADLCESARLLLSNTLKEERR